jgi:hypothetical protein
MTAQTIPARRQPECKLAFHVERGPHFLSVAIRGEAGFDQSEAISAQLLRIPPWRVFADRPGSGRADVP